MTYSLGNFSFMNYCRGWRCSSRAMADRASTHWRPRRSTQYFRFRWRRFWHRRQRRLGISAVDERLNCRTLAPIDRAQLVRYRDAGFLTYLEKRACIQPVQPGQLVKPNWFFVLDHRSALARSHFIQSAFSSMSGSTPHSVSIIVADIPSFQGPVQRYINVVCLTCTEFWPDF